MQDIPLKQIIEASLSKIGTVADVNTVIGEPITTEFGVTIVPFSKVSVGFASGGVDFDSKQADKEAHFAGGNGAGVSVTPLGFLVIEKENVRILDLKHPESFAAAPTDPVNKLIDSLNGIVDKAPDLIGKIKDVMSKKPKQEDVE